MVEIPDMKYELKKNAAKTGISSSFALGGAAVGGPLGAVAGAVVGASAGTWIDHRNRKRDEKACRAIEEVRQMVVDRYSPDRAVPTLVQLDDLSEAVGCVRRVRNY